MKTGLALSIQQPWAWLIIRPDITDPVSRAKLYETGADIKDVENRDWPTKVRGVIGVHAGKKFDLLGYNHIKRVCPWIPMPEPDGFRMGGVIGRVRLVDCVTSSRSRWFEGVGYGFVLDAAEPLPFIPCRGMLGFFTPALPPVEATVE